MSTTTTLPPDLINPTTIYSLSAVALITTISLLLPHLLLPTRAQGRSRALFAWSTFSSLIHFTIETPYLYNCFFTFVPINRVTPPSAPTLPMTAPGVYFLNQPSRLYGAFYGQGLTAKLWQEYARADKRWGGADLGIISLELLTCAIMAPLAVLVCVNLTRGNTGAAWFWGCVVATSELYGGFMTFAPEWLTGSPNLDTGNWMFLWLYLIFFNMLWVVLPVWVLWEGYGVLTGAGAGSKGTKVVVETGPAGGKKNK